MKKLYECMPSVLSPHAKVQYEERLSCYISNKVPKELAKNIAALPAMISGTKIVQVSQRSKFKEADVAKIYFDIGERLELDWLRKQLDKMNSSSYWQKTSMKTLIDEISSQQKRLTSSVIKNICPSGKLLDGCVDSWADTHTNHIARYMRFIDDIKTNEDVDFAMILVAIGKVKEIGSN